MAQEILREPDGAERHAGHGANVSADRERELTTSTAEVHHEHGTAADARLRHHSEMDEAPFFEAGDDFELPSRGGAQPLSEHTGILRITHRAGGHDADAVGIELADGPAEPLDHLDGMCHRVWVERAGAEHALTAAG